MTRLRISSLGVALATAALVWALPATAHETRAAAKTVNVTAYDIGFKLSSKTAPAGLVVFKVKNTGKLQHDFKISSRKTKLLGPGKSATLRITLKKGSYKYLCTVPGHAAAGMRGVFKVT
jgi:uncharacterized cupredoxin-like copper-binding protein